MLLFVRDLHVPPPCRCIVRFDLCVFFEDKRCTSCVRAGFDVAYVWPRFVHGPFRNASLLRAQLLCGFHAT